MTCAEAAALSGRAAGAQGRPSACSSAPKPIRWPQQLLLLCLRWLTIDWWLKKTDTQR